MTLLLTGATGQLGRELLPRLQAMGPVLAPPRAAFDLALPERLARSLDAWRPRVIVNAAAWTDVDGAEADEAAATRINAEAVVAVARWAAAHDALVVQVSTDHVFDGRGGRPYTEDDSPAPGNAYGRSKLAGERALAASGADALLRRGGGLYGAQARCFAGRLLGRAGPPR
ncbi:MAG: SDR family oxidoreductase, partial [Moraxellaceae bacterium]